MASPYTSAVGGTPWTLLVAAVVLCLAVAPAESIAQTNGSSETKGPSWQERLVVAVAVPLSGEYEPIGRQVLEAARIAANDAGVDVIARDTKGEAAVAAKVIRKLADDDRVAAVIGPIGLHESRAAAVSAQRAGLPLFTLAGSDAINRVGDAIYRLRHSPAEEAKVLAKEAHDRLQVDSVAIAFPETRYGRTAAISFAAAFVEEGGTLSGVTSYPEDTTNFSKYLDVLVGKRVETGRGATIEGRRAGGDGFVPISRKPDVDFDAIFVPDFHTRVARLLPFLPGSGIQTGEGGEGVGVQLLGLAGWQGASMRLTGAHAAGAIYTDTFAGETAGGRAEEFSRLFEGETGRKPVNLEAEVFDGAWIICRMATKAARQLDETDADGVAALRVGLVRNLPRQQAVTGVSGPLRFGKVGEPIRPIDLYRFDVDGAVVPLP